MDKLTRALKDHYAATFRLHGTTPRGVDWNGERETLARYDKMLAVLQKDFVALPAPSVLDVGCGWGGLLERAKKLGIEMGYSGIDVASEMIDAARVKFPGVSFEARDVFDITQDAAYDFVVCNGILTQKLAFSIPEMEQYARRLIKKMFALCRHGVAFNMMSTRVNFTAGHLYYQNPAEMLTWLLTEISSQVRLDHGYCGLPDGNPRLYEFTTYVYKN